VPIDRVAGAFPAPARSRLRHHGLRCCPARRSSSLPPSSPSGTRLSCTDRSSDADLLSLPRPYASSKLLSRDEVVYSTENRLDGRRDSCRPIGLAQKGEDTPVPRDWRAVAARGVRSRSRLVERPSRHRASAERARRAAGTRRVAPHRSARARSARPTRTPNQPPPRPPAARVDARPNRARGSPRSGRLTSTFHSGTR